MVAHHELGHALVAMALPGSDPVHKISIIPRGVAALGYTLQRPTEDRFLMTRDELENKMSVLLGGRAAEEVVFDHLSTGAANDLAKVTEIARSMVMRYGMVKALGHVAYENEPAGFLEQQHHARSSSARPPRARSTSRCARSSTGLRQGARDPRREQRRCSSAGRRSCWRRRRWSRRSSRSSGLHSLAAAA